MCSSFTRDLPPELLARVESLLHPPYLISDNPWKYNFSSLGSRFNKGWSRGESQNHFLLFMSGKQFRPSEIEVKLEDGSVVVEAKHGDCAPLHGLTSSEFRRSYKLPDGIEPATLSFAFNEKGVLVISTSKKPEVATPVPGCDAAVSVPERTHDVQVAKDEVGALGKEKVD